MISRGDQEIQKGSWLWSLRVAEKTAWGTAAFTILLLHLADMPSDEYKWGLVLVAGLCAWLTIQFRFLLPRFRHRRGIVWVTLAVNFAFASGAFGLMRGEVLNAHLIFVPVIVATGLLVSVPEGLAAAGLGAVCYWGVADLVGDPPDRIAGLVTSAMFLLIGGVSSLLARELRTHYRGEQAEHRLATAVRQRLMAVLDAVDEAVVYRDRENVVRVINQRAGELFDIAPDEFLSGSMNELLRRVARLTEDPEGFMETFQDLRDDPELELRIWVEQIIPKRRQLRLYSGPTYDDAGTLVGRIDVYTDVTESVRRAEEIERLYEDARKTAETYQRSLLPDTSPALPRFNVVAHYIPAAGSRAVCGDFYDYVPWPDGRMGVVLGDVVGIGPKAANDAALTRYTLRSLVADESDPALLFQRLNDRILTQVGAERFARLLLGVLDPERAVLEYVNAGHVPPVVYRARTGEVEWLGEGGLALGIEADARYKIGRIELEPGDMLVLYTDGVTEAPRLGQPFGQGKFGDIIGTYGVGTPGELVQAIRRAVQAWVETGDFRDDLAMLVMQVIPDSLIGEPTRELVLPNETARMGQARAFVAEFLSDIRAPVEVSHDILLAVGEAAGNAARHGRREEQKTEIRMRCALERGVLSVTVADEGAGFDTSRVHVSGLPDRFASGGRGLFLMLELMDEVDISSSAAGTVVVMKKRLFEAKVPA